ncbi:MAG TPA: GAF domain-containing protein [Gaiellaceae bacterium]|nr:GAF domain-containing protein [Gaiellaceae bacterium]
MSDLRAAAAAGVLMAEEGHQRLLDAIVEVARAIFSARAASILLLDEEADELVFAAVAGEGGDTLVGRGFPASTGVAGWVAVTRQPLVLEDVGADPRFARDVAEGTGYVPKGLMAVPLLDEEQALGVLQVLDRQATFTLQEMELLGLFATQAAVAVNLLRRARRARLALDAADGDAALVARLADAVERLPEERRDDGVALLAALVRVLGPT